MSAELRHGTWWESKQGIDPEQLMQGRFSRLFDPHDAEPAVFDTADLEKLAVAMTAEDEGDPTPEDQPDTEENTGIAAAYTYLGQFIDHDLTLDPTSHLRQVITDLDKLVDFRTPRFDLDCLYGRGPSEQPYLYDRDSIFLLLGRPLSGNPFDPDTHDLQRGPNGRALIGDPRNDENRIVAQLHATLIRFHNRMVELMPGEPFEVVRDQVRWHYQWVVLNDFLPTIINSNTINEVFPHLEAGCSLDERPPQFRIPALQAMAHPTGAMFMPVEFSVAAYRFGHSMIRPLYRINPTIERRPIFSGATDPSADLGGMRPIPDDWGIDWQSFLDLGGGDAEVVRRDGSDPTHRKPQLSYKIDTSLVNPLSNLPPVIARNPPSLPARNLLRGNDFRLPSGQTVARTLDLKPLDDENLHIGKAVVGDQSGRPITAVSNGFAGNAPLWTYVLAEAHANSWAHAAGPVTDATPVRLGQVGGHLVAEVFAALLLADRTSFPNVNPAFAPRPEVRKDGQFGLADLITAALAAEPRTG
jgi:hypothetical protein